MYVIFLLCIFQTHDEEEFEFEEFLLFLKINNSLSSMLSRVCVCGCTKGTAEENYE